MAGFDIFKAYEPAHDILVLVTFLSNEGSGETAQTHKFADSSEPSLLAYTMY